MWSGAVCAKGTTSNPPPRTRANWLATSGWRRISHISSGKKLWPIHQSSCHSIICQTGWLIVRDALETLIDMSREKRVAIMCAETVPWRCHRSLVADALSVHGVPVIEILSERTYRMHKLTPFAKVEGMRITYPPDQPMLL